MSQWKGIKRLWEDDPEFKSIYSDELNSKNWFPNLPEYVEEDEDGSAKQKFIFVDDIPEPYRTSFVSWAGNKVKTIIKTKREDSGEVTEEVTIKCAKTRVWKRWVRKNL